MKYPFAAFSGFGIEAEYMICDAETYAVRPIADRLLARANGSPTEEVERDGAAWSNELALHVIEIKTAGITSDFQATARTFRTQIDEINALLAEDGALLVPGGMHPSMDPESELRLWPHENDIIYQTFDRIFDCRGHGWANLQSVHINFPFQSEEEFGRLHAALRVVLPLIPALTASSPFASKLRQKEFDHRVEVYRHNARQVPSVSGFVIPERLYSSVEYRELLEGIYASLRAHDPEGVLAEEWVNARGAIARFDRGAIELRLIDTQECPEQDLAFVSFVTRLVRALYDEKFVSFEVMKELDEEALLEILLETTKNASAAVIDKPWFLKLFGQNDETLRARDLVARLIPMLLADDSWAKERLAIYLAEGTLAERLVRKAGSPGIGTRVPDENLLNLTRELSNCLKKGEALRGS